MKIYYSCFNSLGDIQIFFFFKHSAVLRQKYYNELLAYDNEYMYIYVGFLQTWKDYSLYIQCIF